MIELMNRYLIEESRDNIKNIMQRSEANIASINPQTQTILVANFRSNNGKIMAGYKIT